jgi:hypothetical protein
MVAETSIRPMRSAKTFEEAAIVVVIPLSLQILGTGGTRECRRGLVFLRFPIAPGLLTGGKSNLINLTEPELEESYVK